MLSYLRYNVIVKTPFTAMSQWTEALQIYLTDAARGSVAKRVHDP